MCRVSGLYLWVAVGVLAGVQASASPQPPPIAQSAQVTLTGGVSQAGLTLRARPTLSGAALDVTDLTVSVDGVHVPATRQADGSWIAPLPAARGGRLEVVVQHDGISEVLSGSLPAPAGSGAALPEGKRARQQLAWWILNITIVLIAALAISRRLS
jgi:hypothetical protein